MPKEDSGNSNLESVKGRIGKPIKAMSFEEQLIELEKIHDSRLSFVTFKTIHRIDERSYKTK